ncbi:MAG: hypothetical protein IJD53_00395 [Alistipes sp.]|nr:hypothetical protein [Alistipes sp.]
MKKIMYTLAVAMLCVTISSCSKDDAPSAQQNMQNLLIGTWISDYDNDWDSYIELELKSNGKGSVIECSEDWDYEYEFKLEWEYFKDGNDDILNIDSDWLEGDEDCEIKTLTDRKLVLEIWGDEFEFEKD